MSNEKIRQIVHIRSDEFRSCTICGAAVVTHDPRDDEDDWLERQVNHYLSHQGCTVLHVGSETRRDMEGNLWLITVATIGMPRGKG